MAAKMASRVVLSLLSLVGLTSAVTPGNIQSYLKSHLSSSAEVLLPSDPAYKTVVGVKPSTAEDVATIVSAWLDFLLLEKF